MARIAGVDIPSNKRVVISLTYIYGIGPTTAKKILAECGISEDIRTRDGKRKPCLLSGISAGRNGRTGKNM